MHHPTSNMLMEHAAGTQSWTLSLVVSAHLQMCNICRHQIHHLNHIGGALLEASPADVPDVKALDQVMLRIDGAAAKPKAFPREAATESDDMKPMDFFATQVAELAQDPVLPRQAPQILRKLVVPENPLEWRKLTPQQEVAPLPAFDNEQVALCRIAAGSELRGRFRQGTEVILVLQGNFSDAKGLYSVGDFVPRKADSGSAGVATMDQACIYLSVYLSPSQIRKGDTGRWRSTLRGFAQQLGFNNRWA